jgi:hypothetical protein
MSYIILRGRWCHIIVLNVHTPIEDKVDDVKDSFYEELKRVFVDDDDNNNNNNNSMALVRKRTIPAW